MRGRGRLAAAALAACGLALAAPAAPLRARESPALTRKSAAALKHARAIAARLDRRLLLTDSFTRGGAGAPFKGLLGRAGLQPLETAAPNPPAPAFKEILPPLLPEPALARCRFWSVDCQNPTDARYETIAGPAYSANPDGSTNISAEDVVQGDLDDCYFMASLAAVAAAHPDVIRRMIRRNADGTFSVTFYKRTPPWEFWKPEYEKTTVRVDNRFPVEPNDYGPPTPLYAQQGLGGIWPMVAEKAYAAYKGSYGAIDGILADGFASSILELITGKDSAVYPAMIIPARALEGWLKAGAVVVVSTKIDLSPWLGSWAKALPGPLYQNGTLVPTHDYWVKSVNVKKGTVTLGNPWGWDDFTTITMGEFRAELSILYVNPVR